MCEAHPPSVFRAILSGKPYQVKALLVSATNPINSYGETKLVLDALKAVDFMVTCDYWMTPTAALSDYVIPIAGALERPTITSSYGCSDFLLASQRAIPPMYERRNDYNFWRDLGCAMGQQEMWPWATVEEAYYAKIAPLGYDIENYDEFVENVSLPLPRA
jgi:thiosulfate reductase / polysulfide reductase chain A